MKKWMVFVLGVLVGIIAMAFIDILKMDTGGAGSKNNEEYDGVTMFDEPGEIFSETSFEVFQVIDKGAALVTGNGKYNLYTGTKCLLINKEGKLYYDEEIVKVPKGKVARQVGIYQYPNREGMTKTVPIVMIMAK